MIMDTRFFAIVIVIVIDLIDYDYDYDYDHDHDCAGCPSSQRRGFFTGTIRVGYSMEMDEWSQPGDIS
jgi:hypothetical protein